MALNVPFSRDQQSVPYLPGRTLDIVHTAVTKRGHHVYEMGVRLGYRDHPEITVHIMGDNPAPGEGARILADLGAQPADIDITPGAEITRVAAVVLFGAVVTIVCAASIDMPTQAADVDTLIADVDAQRADDLTGMVQAALAEGWAPSPADRGFVDAWMSGADSYQPDDTTAVYDRTGLQDAVAEILSDR